MFVQLTNQTQFLSWNQPVLSYESKVSCSRKQQEPLMWFERQTRSWKTILKNLLVRQGRRENSSHPIALTSGFTCRTSKHFHRLCIFFLFLPIPW